jgi:hypothetical protein
VTVIRRHPVWTLIAVGVAIRLVLAFALVGNYDVGVWAQVDDALDRDPLDVYGVNRELGGEILFLWPYPPLYLAGIALSSGLSDLTGLPFHGTVQLLPILADVGIALAIYVHLGWRRATERTRVAGAALVLLGPCFIAISGYHGQFDQVAVLPAVLALMAWERRPAGQRALESGLRIGAGAAAKTVPGLLVLPLLPSTRSPREAAKLVGAAVAVPAILLLPFLVVDPTDVLNLRHYQGVPGLGGLSLVTDPAAGADWMTLGPFDHDHGAVGGFVYDHPGTITLVGVLALAAFVFRYRPAPIDGAVLLWLAIYVFNPNFFLHYLVWGLPFFIMAGYLREVALLQLLLVPALVIYYLVPFSDAMPAAAIYVPLMIALWAFWVVALVTLAARVARQRTAYPTGTQPPLVGLTRSDLDVEPVSLAAAGLSRSR